MKKITTVLLMLWFVQSSSGAEPELKSVLGKYFSNVTAAPGRITVTLDPNGVRISYVNYVKDGRVSVLLEKGETISLAPGFSEVHFVEGHSWISIKRVGSGNVYEVTSAIDARSFGKELEETKYTLLFSQTELEFKEGSPGVDKPFVAVAANKKRDLKPKSLQTPSGSNENQSAVLPGNPSKLSLGQEFPWLWIIIAVLIAAGGLLWWLLKRRK